MLRNSLCKAHCLFSGGNDVTLGAYALLRDKGDLVPFVSLDLSPLAVISLQVCYLSHVLTKLQFQLVHYVYFFYLTVYYFVHL
jgi:hypothetical protein